MTIQEFEEDSGMKRIISIIFVLCLAVTMNVSAYFPDVSESNADEKAIFDVYSLGIMQGYEDGTFRADNNVTRAEFAKIAMAMQGINDCAAINSDFEDIDVNHWASGYIEIAKGQGLINGFEDNTFRPNDNVTLNQAVKIMTVMLGRGYEAERQGGYPSGYIRSAGSCGLLNGVKESGEEPLKRGSVARLVYNCLDTVILTVKNSSSPQPEEENTLREKLLKKDSLKKVRGVVTATEYTSLNASAAAGQGKIAIDGVEYDTNLNISDYLGYNVDAYINEDDDKIVSVKEYKNKKWKINAEDVASVDNEEMHIYRENNAGKEKIGLDKPAVIYNGKKTDSIPSIYNGTYELIDNDSDNKAEVVKIIERESFVVKRVSSDSIYFDNEKMFRGRTAFKIMKDDSDYEYTILNYDGEKIGIDSIKAGNSVTIIASQDKQLVRIIVGDETIEGAVTGINSSADNYEISIDGNSYAVRNDANGSPLAEVSVGDKAVFALDEDGGIIGIVGNVETEGKFGYVINAFNDDMYQEKFKAKVVSSGKKEKNVEVVNDSEIISYDFANSRCATIEFASKVKVNGTTISASSLNRDMFIGKLIKYTLNKDGKISKCTLHQLPTSIPSYNFNAKTMSFGGYAGRETFFADNADILCVPEIADSENDYYEIVTLTDKGTYSVYPIEIDNQTQKAKSVVISAKMDADTPQPIDSSDDASIVGGVYTKLNEYDESVLCIRILTRDEVGEIVVSEDSEVYETASELKKGDLIRYSLNAFNELSNLRILASIRGLTDFYRAYENSPNEMVYAMVNTVEINRISELRNEMVDKLSVVFSEDGSGKTVEYELPREDGPVIYKYNRGNGDISTASCDEMTSFEEVGSDASRVFLFVNSNDVEIAVIIEE